MVVENNENITPITKTQKNQHIVHEMIMESYQDMLTGKGRDCKKFFDELESRYKNAKI